MLRNTQKDNLKTQNKHENVLLNKLLYQENVRIVDRE
jgi:hypothetical protein